MALVPGGGAPPDPWRFTPGVRPETSARLRDSPYGVGHMVSSVEPESARLDELESLVLQAFGSARRRGKPDWYRMAPAVLKNRLLDVTDRRFDQSQYGVERFADLLPLLSELVALDTSSGQRIVELRPGARALLEEDDSGDDGPSRFRVRPDLWDAVLDFSSGVVWRWDAETGQALPSTEEATPDDERLPTIAAELFAQWRHTFIAEHAAEIPPDAIAAAEEWAELGRRSEMLPRSLRGKWFAFLKDRVVATLETWFAENGLAVPRDLREQAHPQRGRSDHVEELRDFVIRCVRKMSPAELETLQLPASAAFRTPR